MPLGPHCWPVGPDKPVTRDTRHHRKHSSPNEAASVNLYRPGDSVNLWHFLRRNFARQADGWWRHSLCVFVGQVLRGEMSFWIRLKISYEVEEPLGTTLPVNYVITTDSSYVPAIRSYSPARVPLILQCAEPSRKLIQRSFDWHVSGRYHIECIESLQCCHSNSLCSR